MRLAVKRRREPHDDRCQTVGVVFQRGHLSGNGSGRRDDRARYVDGPERSREGCRHVADGQSDSAGADVDAEEAHASTIMPFMGRKTRTVILVATIPIVAFTIVGGFLGRAVAREDAYRHLRIFEDVVAQISSKYVEEVDLDAVMKGALRGLADGLDSESTFLTADDVARIESGGSLPAGALGVEVAGQYYVQVIGVTDGTPADRAGIRPGDYIRAIDGQTTRLVSGIAGERLLRGEPGSTVTLSLLRGTTQEPYDIELTREQLEVPSISHRVVDGDVGYIRIPAFGTNVADQLASASEQLRGAGATRLLIDVRSTAGGEFEAGIDAARLFVASGTLLRKTEQGDVETMIEANAGDAAITTPVTLLTNFGTAQAAELFVAALRGTERADTVGQRTAGRASQQRLVRLPDGTGIWLSWARYVQASGDAIHRSGISPTVEVDVPRVELGEPAPPDDPIFDRGLEHVKEIGA